MESTLQRGTLLLCIHFRPKKMLWFPLPLRVYLKPAASKIFMVFAMATPISGG
jgi:hypothetical protein